MTTEPIAPEPPRRGRGQPRRVERRISIGFPADLLAELEALRESGAIPSISAEVVRRCRATPAPESAPGRRPVA
jgi:hypothetical protein